ncbi:SDR family NAD(P)-dependent oxidoreductase [Nocardioides ferulae]|uniref:SDR family NAD(P)-dependent oxidoreductase n=1 Tax=Nocardioides ferulae TaxID=2340821 RepID=UPI000EB36B34|nr:SDR family NAD(P)-dependent oxidoreductase [Nocardioides ferulae]
MQSSQPGAEPRVVVVTGAASGIGHATARQFADQGDTVLGLDLGDSVPDGVEFVHCDVASRASVEAAIARAAEHGRIDVLANVAGVVQFGRVETITEAEWDRVLAVDLKGPFLMIQAALAHLRASRGCIVNVASVAGRIPQPYAAAYGAAKGGLVQLTRSLALELAPDGVRVNAICPGGVMTPMIDQVAARYPTDLDPKVQDRLHGLLPHGFLGPDEVAAAIVFLSSPQTRSITGDVMAVDAGMF